jgi:serine phosphatase RsbU (regulator of sigma subunit)/anti-sigma regulatory factor (Ser/Thr protein kinase)
VTATSTTQRHGRSRRRPAWTNVAVVVVIGVVVTGALMAGARRVHESNEDRLLAQQNAQVAAVLSAAIPSVQAPLTAAANVAEATDGARDQFRELAQVPKPTKQNPNPTPTSVTLWRLDPTTGPALVDRVGVRPLLPRTDRGRLERFFRSAAGKEAFSVVDLLEGPSRRLGFAYTVPAPNAARYLIYREVELSNDRSSQVDSNPAFADIHYALYVGNEARPDKLIASSTGGAGLTGRTASTVVGFGDTSLLVVVSPRNELGGSLLAWLPWILGVFGLVCTAAAALTVWRLSRRRNQAEELADENERLYADQRSLAQTLQHSLLPQALPDARGLEFGAIYAPGTEGIDIGGDWYEVITRPDGTVVVVVGDVSGHGLDAATIMASLRFAIRAFASQGDGPGMILGKLARLVSVGRDGHFATVLCGVLDPADHTATWAAAGHPRPVLYTDGQAEFVEVPVGPPVGVVSDAEYADSRHRLPAAGTLLLYTDGLVERRGESIDAGFDRLADAIRATASEPLAEALFSVVRRAIPDGCDDDAALLGIRWPADAPVEPASFPGSPASVTAARAYVSDALDDVEPEVVQVVALLVSELATNSVHHADAGFTLDIERRAERIRVAVSDAGPGAPVMRSPEPVESSGRGLRIVAALSEEWGCSPSADGTGKTVWFEVAAASVSG